MTRHCVYKLNQHTKWVR